MKRARDKAVDDGIRIRAIARLLAIGIAGSPDECWIWPRPWKGHRYGQLSVNKIKFYVHRLSYEHHHGPLLDGEEVCHSCDTPLCWNPRHLWAGTHAQNMADMADKGRHRVGMRWRGEDNANAKLTADNVKEIRKCKNSDRVEAKRYGVSRALIRKIRAGEVWKCAL